MNFTAQQLTSFMALATVMSVTPGPNNLMVLFSSVRFGATRTVGHIAGASFGSALMFLIVGLGLHGVFTSHPLIQDVMKYTGAGYIIYLSWKIMRDSGEILEQEAQRPMTFTGAALFQWINPKSWVMATVAVSTCLPVNFVFSDIAFYTVLFCAVSFPCVGIWAWFGDLLKRYLREAKLVRRLNLSCAILLVFSAISMTIS